MQLNPLCEAERVVERSKDRVSRLATRTQPLAMEAEHSGAHQYAFFLNGDAYWLPVLVAQGPLSRICGNGKVATLHGVDLPCGVLKQFQHDD
jgi:hypothetical protein